MGKCTCVYLMSHRQQNVIVIVNCALERWVMPWYHDVSDGQPFKKRSLCS